MTIARRQLIDVSVTRWYHCMSRCVRGASLLCDGPSDRKAWIENRIEELAQIFAVGVGGFSVMDNIDDRRRFDSPREGMFEGLSIGNYLLLVDFTGRVFREGKARISADLAGILDRIGSSAQRWQLRMEKLKNGRSFGRFFAASRDKLREIAQRLNVRRLVNLVGCAAP